MKPNRRSDWPARRSAEPASMLFHVRSVVYMLAFAALAGCSEREPVTAPAVPAPHFSQHVFTPVVNNLADPGDGACDDAGTGDGCTLREAIDYSYRWGATITFDPALTSAGPQVITLVGQLLIQKSV